jgi:hypothetical protein
MNLADLVALWMDRGSVKSFGSIDYSAESRRLLEGLWTQTGDFRSSFLFLKEPFSACI